MKKKVLSTVLSVIVSFTVMNPSIITNAATKNLNMIVLFKDNKIDNHIEDVVTEAGGTVVRKLNALGGMEVECNPEIIPKIKESDSVESVSPNKTITIKKNNVEDSSQYYKNEGNSYYVDKNNNYYEDNNNGYYDNTGNSYYEDNSQGYYQDTGSSYWGDQTSKPDNPGEQKPDDPYSGNLYERYQWDIKKVTNNGQSFNIESGNHNVSVGIIDSGVDTDHQDLKGNLLGGKNFIPKNFKNDRSETGDINDIEDRYGHGTEVAGQIAANGRIKGVAPQVGFKSYRVFNKNGETNASICSDAIVSAVDDGNKVLNLSFGAYYLDGECILTNKETGEKQSIGDDMADYALLERAIKYAADRNVVVVTSANNDHLDCSDSKKLVDYYNDQYEDDGIEYRGCIYEGPGSFDGVITVSATDKNNNIASYSNYGEKFIDIAAPGGDYGYGHSNENMCISTSLDNGYTFDLGTSLAAPKVSAAAAILICRNGSSSVSEVENKLYQNADKSWSYDKKYYGAGIVNIYNAIK